MITPPTRLVLETAAVCNLHCPQCWTGLGWVDRGKGSRLMKMDLFNRVVDEAQDFATYVYLHNWGEPTLNNHLPEMIRRTKEFAQVDVTTHGLLIDEKLADAIADCDQIGVSIDGITQEVYEKYRVGGNLDDALRGLKMLHDRAGNRVRWIFVVFKENEHQIPAAQELADSLGIRIEFKSSAFWNRETMTASMPTDEQYRRFRIVNGEWQLKADRLRCREFWDTVYVLPTGDVSSCCYDGQAQYITGNVWKNSLLDIWNGDAYSRMRATHSRGTLNTMCQEYCQLPA